MVSKVIVYYPNFIGPEQAKKNKCELQVAKAKEKRVACKQDPNKAHCTKAITPRCFYLA